MKKKTRRRKPKVRIIGKIKIYRDAKTGRMLSHTAAADKDPATVILESVPHIVVDPDPKDKVVVVSFPKSTWQKVKDWWEACQ